MSENKYSLEAVRYFRDQQFEKALLAYNKAIAITPDDPDLFSERGVTHFHLGNKHQALKDMNKAVELEPDYSYRYASRAYIKDSIGMIKEAIDDYKMAVTLDPSDAISLNNLGMLEEKLGYTVSSREHLKKADEIGLSGMGIEPADSIEIKPKNLQKEYDEEQAKLRSKGYAGIMRDALTKRADFMEFLRFVRAGFKHKPR